MTKLEKLRQFLESEGYELDYEGLEDERSEKPYIVTEYSALGIELRITSRVER